MMADTESGLTGRIIEFLMKLDDLFHSEDEVQIKRVVIDHDGGRLTDQALARIRDLCGAFAADHS